MAYNWNAVLDTLVDRISDISTTIQGEDDEPDVVTKDFATVSRRVKFLVQLQPADMPACFVATNTQTDQNEVGRAPLLDLMVDLYVCVRDVDSEDGPEPLLLDLLYKIQDDLETEIIADQLTGVDVEGFRVPTDLENLNQTVGILTVVLHARG